MHRLGPGELDELLRLYQTTSGHLSYVRTYFRDGPLVVRLTALVAAASAVIYGRRGRVVDAIIGFFGTSFPAAVWGSRRAIGWSAALFLVPAVAMGLWLLNSPAAMEESASASERETYVEDQFEQYYSDRPSPQFATEVTVNNIGVSVPRVRPRRRRVRLRCPRPRGQRGDVGAGGGVDDRRRRQPPLLGVDPPPRTARDLGHRHRRGGRPAPRVDAHRSR